MPQVVVNSNAQAAGRREPSVFFRRMERKLGTRNLTSDNDLARLVEDRLPLTAVDSLSASGLTDDEIYTYIVPRRTLLHRKTKCEPLTHDESDRAVRIARISSLAEQVFGDDAKAGRWLRKPKQRFAGRTPMEVSRTEAGARLVEEMLLQLDYGIVA
jgi:putative toxin-antitoxin system antitoxin component (TIGR02293 family)